MALTAKTQFTNALSAAVTELEECKTEAARRTRHLAEAEEALRRANDRIEETESLVRSLEAVAKQLGIEIDGGKA